jgi:hypothetical protein
VIEKSYFLGVPFKMLAKTNEVTDSLVEIEMKLVFCAFYALFLLTYLTVRW